MKKKILISTNMERATRILLRTELFELLKSEYDIVIASPAEQSPKWKEEFAGDSVSFFYDFLQDNSIVDLEEGLSRLDIAAILSCSNSDVPEMQFDVGLQKSAKSLNIPIIVIQDFIDMIFHPMTVKPDLYLCWGEFFKHMLSRKRDVLVWNHIGSLHGMAVEEPLDNVKVVGVPHFDIYRKSEFYNRDRFTKEIGFIPDKPIFLFLPNGEISQWVFDTFDNFMEAAKINDGQVIIKTHPIRTGDSWIYNLIIKKYKNILCKIIDDPSMNKGTAFGVKGYGGHNYHMDLMDMWSLGNILYNSDIVCSIPSTTALEAMIFNKPVVLETMHWSHPYEVRRNVMNWWWNVLDEYRCCKRSKKYGELFQYVEEYLKNPDVDMPGRANLIDSMFYGAKGNACQNSFNAIKEFLG